MKVDFATSKDCRAIADVHVDSWRAAYRDILSKHYLATLSVDDREEMWRQAIESQSAHVLVARTDADVAGFLAMGESRDEDAPEDRVEIFAIYVRPSFWSTGCGYLLWLEALKNITDKEYKSISLWVIEGNSRAIQFYERLGFCLEPGTRKLFEIAGKKLSELRYLRDVG